MPVGVNKIKHVKIVTLGPWATFTDFIFQNRGCLLNSALYPRSTRFCGLAKVQTKSCRKITYFPILEYLLAKKLDISTLHLLQILSQSKMATWLLENFENLRHHTARKSSTSCKIVPSGFFMFSEHSGQSLTWRDVEV